MHSGHEISTDGQWTGDMAPEHDVGLQVDPDSYDHGDCGESDGFEVLMVVVEEEWSCDKVRLSSFSTTVDAVAFCFDCWPTSSRIREFSTAVHDWFNDVIFGVELI